MPPKIVERFRAGESLIADSHENVCILFSDIVDFGNLASRVPISEVFYMLSNLFVTFDRLVDGFGVDKVETVGRDHGGTGWVVGGGYL